MSCALSMFLTTNGPKDQNSPAIKTTNIAELILSLGIYMFPYLGPPPPSGATQVIF